MTTQKAVFPNGNTLSCYTGSLLCEPTVAKSLTCTLFLEHPGYLCFKEAQQIEELTLSHWVFYSDYTEINGRPQGCQNLEPGLRGSELRGMWQSGGSLSLK